MVASTKRTAIFQRSLKGEEKTMRAIAAAALLQDGKSDITSDACVKRSQRCKARIIAKEPGVFCGLIEAKEVFRGMSVCEKRKDGEKVSPGDIVLEITGSAREILRRERTALNFIMHLSGVATATNKLARKYPGKIATLRKTHPLLSGSEKRAVQVGGGLTHRLSLGDGYLIKNNHLTAIATELGCSRPFAVSEAVERAFVHRKTNGIKCFIEVEVGDMKEAMAAAESEANAVLVDNCSPDKFARIAKAIRKMNKKIVIEASGGINDQNAGAYISRGAELVSTSRFTLRSRPVDFALRIEY